MVAKMKRVGRYEIIGELGRGAMGVVYRAQDPVIGRPLAIKTIRLGEFSDPQEADRLRERLFREARSAGILSHPNIVTIYDMGEDGDIAFIAMEFVSGHTLEQALKRDGTIDRKLLLSVLAETASGLDYAHGRGIVHRDIKPGNIMIDETKKTKIADFGIAKILSQNATQTQMVLGTPTYMSPEQIESKPLDGRVDQYSMAVIAYEMLTGERPFSAESLPALLFKIVREQASAPHLLNALLDESVSGVFSRAMAKNRDERFPNCTEFINALTEALVASPEWMPFARGSSGNMPTVAIRPPEEESTGFAKADTADTLTPVPVAAEPPVAPQARIEEVEPILAPPPPPPPSTAGK